MFSSTAYEAYYTYIGIYLHEASIQIITSQEVLMGILVLILGLTFFFGTWQYFSKFMPHGLGTGRTVGISFFFKVIACFLIGMSLLKVDVPESIKTYKRTSWHTNPYVQGRFPGANESYKVSFIFDLLIRAAEEISQYGSTIVDGLFAKTNSELEAPAAFYKAVLFAGSQTIDDPALVDKIDVYTRSCFDQVLPLLGLAKKQDRIDEFFRKNGVIDTELSNIPIQMEDGQRISCLDLKNEMREHLWAYAEERGAKFYQLYHGKIRIHNYDISKEDQKNLIASNALVNHYLSKSEDVIGTQEGAKVEGTLANVFLAWSRFWSFDGFFNMVGLKSQVGAALTAERAEKFSEYLQRAPHLKGIVKMFLIAIFPWLVFLVVAGRWRIIFSWFAVYCSVLLWTPIWTLLYHLMTSIALSNELMQEFGKVSADGISLYSSSFITAKLYQFYAIYSWLQLVVGPLPTVILGYGLFSSFLKDSQSESAPPMVTTIKDVGMGAATGGFSGGVAGGASGAMNAAKRHI